MTSYTFSFWSCLYLTLRSWRCLSSRLFILLSFLILLDLTGHFLHFLAGVFGTGVDVRKFDGPGISSTGWLVCPSPTGKGVVLSSTSIVTTLSFSSPTWTSTVSEELPGIAGIDDKLHVAPLSTVLLQLTDVLAEACFIASLTIYHKNSKRKFC